MKVVLIGDDCTGKRRLMLSYSHLNTIYISKNLKSLEEDDMTSSDSFEPTICDHSILNVQIECGSKVDSLTLQIHSISGEEDIGFHHMRQVTYGQADFFVLSFSVVNRNTFLSVADKWIPEIAELGYRKVPFVLVGTKADLRDDQEAILRLQENNRSFVSYSEGEELAKAIGAVAYIECSAVTKTGMYEIIETVVRKNKNKVPKNDKCMIM
eukprot:TRINITY_DN12108_c0_g1_i1.p1 TRINITY_DN12108_c0_g1~~TRINITY_DN12108_c0_g1_i1.p1  ORF type:complete len:226 (-),score=49.71 TRINITY_DN12108_c0_g1_i1:9-641(-)